MTNAIEKSDIIPKPPKELIDRLVDSGDESLVWPTVATEALQLTNDPNCSMSTFACVVERDATLAIEIISLANSPLFSCGFSNANLHQSLVRLGLRQCRNLILSACVSGMMKNISLEQEWIRELLWQHSFTTATACLHLNRSLGLGFHGEEFTAGLLHDFGRTLLAVVCEDKFTDADPLNFVEEEWVLGAEEKVLGTNHCDFGAWYANHYGLPKSLQEVMRWHHDPARESDYQRLIAMVSAADHIANHIQRFDEAAGYDPETNEAISVLGQLYDKNIVENFSEIAPQLLTDVRESALTNRAACKEVTK